jgi:hypothetical protein
MTVSGIDAGCIVAPAQVLHERVTVNDHLRSPVSLQPPHRPQGGLEPAVVTPDTIVGVLLGVVERGGKQLLDPMGQGLSAVCDDFVRLDLGRSARQ